MPDEGSFLQAILTNPTDDLPRLVYADWLEEQQTDEANRKAEFLRVTVEVAKETKARTRTKLEQRIEGLARFLPTDWLPVVSRVSIDNCAVAGNAIRQPLETIEFEFECPKRWEALTPTTDVGVRHCDVCKQKVYYCDTIGQAREHALQGHCVAVDLALPRAEGDIEERPRWNYVVMGRPSPVTIRKMERDNRNGEQALRISEEREQAKRNS